MILYITKKTKDRFNIPLYSELTDELELLARNILVKEQDDIFKWGVKIFYFDRRKCLQIMNFASKVSIFLIDIKVQDVKEISNMLAHYLKIIYEDDLEVVELLDRYFKETPISFFDTLKDRSVIGSLNHNERYFLEGGYRLYDFIENGTLHTIRLNKQFNFRYIVGKKSNGKTEYIVPGEEFKKMLSQRYEILYNQEF
ncbi:DUF6933 domain-containing protein [Peptostreptococcus sp.]|jgi:hypothetical protein|uniref:DUF6933 domain-containing protein n=1 Tax=Peptostreptococcus sp. TaxID=1262 RepID=UPI001CAD8588|nr:hypothetical protein [Peptostreptococcus sp.]MBF1045202.1 hypothetical protein [Peptostreptococcus sp.]MBF1050322.1 hypothetical protein [Peptostreptococcus sp.]